MFKLALGQAPLTDGNDLASGPTFSRLEHQCTRKDIYRLAKAFVEAFITSDAKPPSVIVLDMDHSEDRTHGQQELAFYNRHYGSHCHLPDHSETVQASGAGGAEQDTDQVTPAKQLPGKKTCSIG